MALLLAICLNTVAIADDEQVYQIDLPEQNVADALTSLSEQTDVLVLFPYDLAEARAANPVKGEYTLQEAMNLLLQGTGLSGGLSQQRVMQISLDEKAERTNEERGKGMSSQGDGGVRVKRRGLLGVLAAVFSVGAGAQEGVEEAGEPEVVLDEIVVTGTNIRGVKDQFSPVTEIGRTEMDLAGQATLADVFSSLPQNFNGGAALQTATGASASGAGSVGVNLRGLGNEATLVLLNGRRLAPGGAFGSFVDIAAIPTSAIDRIEIVPDGASAIYGSDAIAGVVNIILRDDFEGAESRLNLSTLTDGGGSAIQAGQLLGFSNDRVNGLLSYEYASQDELDANDRDFSQDLPDPTYLLPFNRRHSLFGSGGVVLTDRIELSADAFFEDRESKTITTSDGSSLVRNQQRTDVQRYGGALGLEIELSSNWIANIDSTYSNSDFLADTQFLHQSPGSGILFESQTELFSVDGSIGGPVFSVSDEPVRVVVGLHHRNESGILLRSDRLTSVARLDVDQERDVFAAYGEIYAPLITEANKVPGISRLVATIAARHEDYSDVGSSFDPRFGLLWSPVEGLDLRGTYGTSFRAPRFDQLIDDLSSARLGVYADPESVDGRSVALEVFGSGNGDLSPEEAETWTIGFDFYPEQVPGLSVSGTYFSVRYDGRVNNPQGTINSQFQFDNFPAVPLRNPNPSTVQDFVDSVSVFFNLSDFVPALGMLTLDDVEVILLSVPQNVSISQVDGFDIQVAYSFTNSLGNWSLSLNSTILNKFTEQFSPVVEQNDLLDTFGNPLDFRLRGGISWSTEPATASLFVNYADGYTDDEAFDGEAGISSFTTVDASLRLDIEEILGGSFANRAFLTLSAQNLFNEEPSMIGSRAFGSPIFDNRNAGPAGRRIGLLLTKQF